MRHKEMAYGGAEDSEYEESSQYEERDFGNGFREDDELTLTVRHLSRETPVTQWEAIQDAFRQLRRY